MPSGFSRTGSAKLGKAMHLLFETSRFPDWLLLRIVAGKGGNGEDKTKGRTGSGS